MINPEAITEARRALGRQLAALRDAAGLNQHQLAPLIHYGRSTIANAETGYSQCSRTFWARCDTAVNADGALLRGYDELIALTRRQQADVAQRLEADRAARLRQLHITATPSVTMESTPDALLLRVRIDGREVVMPLNRRALLRGGIGSLLEVFALGDHGEAAADAACEAVSDHQLTLTSQAHLEEILTHLREQWHALVRTDNLLGPRFALAGVRNQISVVDALLLAADDSLRDEVVRIGSQYAESAAWLYEDSADLERARYWLGRAMEWAYEVDDKTMMAWTAYRRSYQATTMGDAVQAIALARAARREEPQLPAPMRAAIRVQEAQGHALSGDEGKPQQLLDEAHMWAATDVTGDARNGHGSFCTASYIEIRRADCWAATGKTKKAIALYEQAVATLPPVYQRDRAAALSRLAATYAVDDQPEQAATTALAALPVARSAGSSRIVREIESTGVALQPHGDLATVATLLGELRDGDAD